MSVLRRSAQVCLETAGRVRGGGLPWKGGFWSEGSQQKVDGLIFGETPPPPGQSRRLESWEIPYWTTCILTVAIGTFTVWAKADTNPHVWGEKEALKQLKEEGII